MKRRVAMGLIHAEVDLSNPRRNELASLKVSALIDTGAITLCIPEHVAVQLNLSELEKRDCLLYTSDAADE